jgi:pimeloyl-ACP methyl ester carboxylesterase
MPTLERPDGVELHWEMQGEGPAVALVPNWWGTAGNFEELCEDLLRDHRLIAYDPRGNGASSRAGPYDGETDAADFEAVLEAAGRVSVALGWGDGCLRAVRVAAARPDLVGSVLAWGNPVGPATTEGTESMIASDGVVASFEVLMRTSFRSAMRSLMSNLNPQLTESAARRRVDEIVEYCEEDAVSARLRLSVSDGAPAESRALGDRLWVLRFQDNPLLSEEYAERTRELAPEAHVETLADGALSRPDLTAALVRKLTAAAREPA